MTLREAIDQAEDDGGEVLWGNHWMLAFSKHGVSMNCADGCCRDDWPTKEACKDDLKSMLSRPAKLAT